MALSQASLKSMLAAQMPAGSTSLPNWTGLTVEAIRTAVSYAADQRGVREKAQATIIGDGASTRFALLGSNVELLPDDEQVAPVNVDTAGIAAPTLAPTIATNAGAGGGTYGAGVWYFAYSYLVGTSETQISPYTTKTTTATGAFTTPLVTLPTGATGVAWYASPASYSPDIRQLGTGTGAATQYLTPPSATGIIPLADGGQPGNFTPDARLDPDIGPDGRVLTGYTTLQLGTAPALGQRVPLLYYRQPIAPTQDTDSIGLPDRYLRIATQMFMHQLLSVNHTSGDSTIHESAFKDLDPLLMEVMDRGLGPKPSDMLTPRW